MQGKVWRGFYLVLYLSQHETSSGMIQGRCFNTILLDSFRGRSKNISYLFAFDRRYMTRSFSVIALGARCWRVHSASHTILALRHDQGKTVYTTADKYGTEPASLWKGVRWSVIRGNSTVYKLTPSFSVTALSWSGSGGLLLGTVGKNTP